MGNEKYAAILLILIIIMALFLYIAANENLFGNLLKSEPEQNLTIEEGDCVDLYYIGKLANGTIIDSSYNDNVNKTDGTISKIFVTTNTSKDSPEGYTEYTNLLDYDYIKGFIEGLIGLKEGDSVTIGPIPPEDAYGVYPKTGDNFVVPDPSTGKNATFQFIKVITNSSMPQEFVDYYGTGKTTLFILRFDTYSIGEKITFYPTWENATVVTKINETKIWTYTTPPEDKLENFTWISISSDGYYGIIYPENTSSVTSINDTTIIVTHNPKKGDTMTQLDYYYGYTYYLTVLDLTDDKINVSYVDESTGDISYYDFNRKITIPRNESQNITYTYPAEALEELLDYIEMYFDTNLDFSSNEYSGKYITYEVQIEKIYKTS